MAINYLNTVDLNKNQLNNAAIQNLSSNPATGVLGQIYYNTTDSVLKICVTASTVGPVVAAVWGAVGGGVESIDLLDSIYVSLVNTGTPAIPELEASLSAVDGTAVAATRFLSKDNTWDVVAFPTPPTVSNATITLTGGTGLADLGGTFTLNQAADKTITFNVGAGAGMLSNANDVAIKYSGTGNIVDAAADGTTIVTTDKILYEDLTDSIVKEIAVSSLLALAPQGVVTSIGPGTDTTVTGTTAIPIVNVTSSVASAIDKIIKRDGSGYGYAQTPASGDSSTKIATTAFVQSAVTGLLEFKGGFRADTGQITSGANYVAGAGNETYLWGAARVAIAIGDYYVASGAFSGDFYGDAAYPLTPGDSVIGVAVTAANASLVTDWAVVQSDTDLATLTTVGIGNVNAGTGINVAYSGGTATVSLAAQNSLTFTNTGPATAGTSYPITAATHGLGSNSSVIMVQVVQVSTGETIYTDVVRGASGLITITFAASQAVNTFRALLQKIG